MNEVTSLRERVLLAQAKLTNKFKEIFLGFNLVHYAGLGILVSRNDVDIKV